VAKLYAVQHFKTHQPFFLRALEDALPKHALANARKNGEIWIFNVSP
jgi:hypothetical protein